MTKIGSNDVAAFWWVPVSIKIRAGIKLVANQQNAKGWRKNKKHLYGAGESYLQRILDKQTSIT